MFTLFGWFYNYNVNSKTIYIHTCQKIAFSFVYEDNTRWKNNHPTRVEYLLIRRAAEIGVFIYRIIKASFKPLNKRNSCEFELPFLVTAFCRILNFFQLFMRSDFYQTNNVVSSKITIKHKFALPIKYHQTNLTKQICFKIL